MEATSCRSVYSGICCQQVHAPSRIPVPPHEQLPHLFPQSTPHYRLNLLVTDGSGDTLYFAYSRTHIARYRIRRCNGVQLEALPAASIHPPTIVNNVRVANFSASRGGRLLIMTGGSELTGEHGTLSIMPLPPISSGEDVIQTRMRHGRKTRRTRNMSRDSVLNRDRDRVRDGGSEAEKVGKAHTFMLPVMSAWGLAVHDETCRIAVSSNSHAILVLSITTSHAFVNVARDSSAANSSTVAPGAGNSDTRATSPNGPNLNHIANIDNDGGEDGDNSSNDDEYLDGDDHGEYDSDDDDPNATGDDDGGFERRFRLIPLSDPLGGTHKENIPCLAFNRRGDRLASASIDTTFAMYDLSESSEPMDMIMDLLVPRVSGRTLFQSGLPSNVGRRGEQRVWAVQWTKRGNLPEVTAASQTGRCILNRFRSQHDEGVWLPDDGLGLGTEADDEDAQDIFRHDCEGHTQSPNEPFSNDPLVMYDDSNIDQDDSSGDYVECEVLEQKPGRGIDTLSEKVEQGFAFLPEVEKRAAWRKRPRGGKRDDGYLLVGYEESIMLYSVSGGMNGETGDTEAEAEGKEPDVVLLDSLHIHSMGLRGQRQVMFTNVIEIEKLKAFVVTGVGGGVFLIRIIEVELEKEEGDDDDEEGRERGERGERGFGARLFVERVFMMENNVIGTCVVERESESRSLRSFELWILQQHGIIQCWDLSERQTPIDISDLV